MTGFRPNVFKRIHTRWFGRALPGDKLSESEQIKRVMNDPEWIASIRRPSVRVQIAAVSKDGGVLCHIAAPHPKAQLAALSNLGGVRYFSGFGVIEGKFVPHAIEKICPGFLTTARALLHANKLPTADETVIRGNAAHLAEFIAQSASSDQPKIDQTSTCSS